MAVSARGYGDRIALRLPLRGTAFCTLHPSGVRRGVEVLIGCFVRWLQSIDQRRRVLGCEARGHTWGPPCIHVEVHQDFAYDGTVDLLLALRVAKRERVEADVIYISWNPVAVSYDLVNGVIVE